MFLLSRPPEAHIRMIVAGQRSKGFSYPDIGATRGEPPSGYALLRGRVDLGKGSTTFHRAVEAIRQWKMFDVSGIHLCRPNAPIQSDEAVAIVIRHFGFWSINCCRIVYVIDEDGPISRFGFAYGTLPEHLEQGEERFTVEWDRTSEVVCYDIFSFSRPGSTAIRIAYPVARWLQGRFLRHPLAAMATAVRSRMRSQF